MALKSETTDEIQRLILQHNVIMMKKLALYYLHMSDEEQYALIQKLDKFGHDHPEE